MDIFKVKFKYISNRLYGRLLSASFNILYFLQLFASNLFTNT